MYGAQATSQTAPTCSSYRRRETDKWLSTREFVKKYTRHVRYAILYEIFNALHVGYHYGYLNDYKTFNIDGKDVVFVRVMDVDELKVPKVPLWPPDLNLFMANPDKYGEWYHPTPTMVNEILGMYPCLGYYLIVAPRDDNTYSVWVRADSVKDAFYELLMVCDAILGRADPYSKFEADASDKWTIGL